MSAEQDDNIAKHCEVVELRVEEPQIENSKDAGVQNEVLPEQILPAEEPLDVGAADELSRPDGPPDEIATDGDLRDEAENEVRTEQLEVEDQGPIDITTDPVKTNEIDVVVAVEVAEDQQIVVVETGTTPGEKHNKGRPRHPFKDLYFEQQVCTTSGMQ